ncbi:MmcQ/YjbR family DNA-binding protein, partial [Streptomyces sp. NPDC001226]
EPEKFWVADHEAQFAWIRVRLATLEDEAELRDILADSWRQAASSRLLDHHPELGSAAGD